jgi:hypothetical protein
MISITGKATSVPLTIKIDDVNDNPSVFEQNQCRRLIQNRALDFDPQLVVKVLAILRFL